MPLNIQEPGYIVVHNLESEDSQGHKQSKNAAQQVEHFFSGNEQSYSFQRYILMLAFR